jgi:hypothetical protein
MNEGNNIYNNEYKITLDKEKIKSELLQKLHDNHVFWSYDKNSCQTIGDFLRNMNICFANLYFDIKHPIPYLKRMESYKTTNMAKTKTAVNRFGENPLPNAVKLRII